MCIVIALCTGVCEVFVGLLCMPEGGVGQEAGGLTGRVKRALRRQKNINKTASIGMASVDSD